MAKFSMVIRGKVFTSKKALTEKCREILWRYRPGDNLSAEDLAFMAELLRYHPDADEKIGNGIEGMFIMPDQWGRQCFAVRHLDGTEIDFSFSSCITVKKPDADFRQACRAAIKGQVLDAKRAAFAAGSVICPVTKEVLSQVSCHVDHEEPNTFKVILDSFIRDRAIDPTSVNVIEVNLECTLTDEALKLDWQQYHRERASLRVVSARANLSDLRRGR